MNVKKLLFNNVISGGGDTPTPTATLITDSLYTHLDANDISGKNWHDRMGHYNFVSDSTLGLTIAAYNLNCEKMFRRYKMAYCSSFKFSAFPFTLEFTVVISAAQSHAILCSCTTLSKFKICCNGDNHLGMYSTNTSPNEVSNLIPVSSITNNTLHVIDYVFVSANKLLVYLDGELTATHTTTIYADGKKMAQGTKITYEPWQAAPAGEDSRNYIGRTQWWDNNSDNGDVVGTLDNFRLYDIALTAEEIANVTSDIKACTKPRTDSCALYSINGRRLETEPSRGMFIKSGKKMIK